MFVCLFSACLVLRTLPVQGYFLEGQLINLSTALLSVQSQNRRMGNVLGPILLGNPGALRDAVGSQRDGELCIPAVTGSGWDNAYLLRKIEREGIG